jgi:glycosyltransferase involved in cell wall biosynthesis
MRVLVLTADYAPGAWSGIGAAVAVETAAVAGQGVEVDVLLPPDREASPAAPRPAGLRIHRLSPARFALPPRAFDIVHLHSLGFGDLAIQLRSRFGLPLVYTAHASVRAEVPEFGGESGWRAVQDLVLARSDHVLFPSTAERTAALSRSLDLHRRSSVQPNGVARGVTPSARATTPGPIAFAGRFAESKGVLLLREIVDRLCAQPGPRFVFAGGHGDELGRRTIDGLVRRHPDRCRRIDWLAPDALERLFAEAGMVVVPSRYEPFGLVALEAMRAGAPVLAAPVGGLREVVGHGSGGLLVVPDNADGWCTAILRLWCSPRLRADLAGRGPRWVAERYDPDRLAQSLVERVYRPLSRRADLVTGGAA